MPFRSARRTPKARFQRNDPLLIGGEPSSLVAVKSAAIDTSSPSMLRRAAFSRDCPPSAFQGHLRPAGWKSGLSSEPFAASRAGTGASTRATGASQPPGRVRTKGSRAGRMGPRDLCANLARRVRIASPEGRSALSSSASLGPSMWSLVIGFVYTSACRLDSAAVRKKHPKIPANADCISNS